MASDIQHQDKTELRIETARFGPFIFQLGLNLSELETLLLRVGDAHKRFRTSPLSQVASRLEKEVVVSSIFGTNSIEGGTLSEHETRLALELDPAKVRNIEQRRALNLKTAYELSRDAAAGNDWRLDVDFIRRVHTAITDGLPHAHNRPCMLRDNAKDLVTHVGDAAHGGRYKPPQYGKDIQLLLGALVQWHSTLQQQKIPALIRAPLVHLYFELIHPFWDGNGRVGRVLEATLLQAEGFRYAPFAQARYYLEHIDAYFTLFNACRKQAEKKTPRPNSAFVKFFLEGMLAGINKLHDRVNSLIAMLVFENHLKHARDTKAINTRQYAIATHVLNAGAAIPLAELRKAPWYTAMYEKRTDKTKQRDLAGLREKQLVIVDSQNRVWSGCVASGE